MVKIKRFLFHIDMSSKTSKGFNLDAANRSFILTEFVELLLHVAEDDGTRRGTDRHGLRPCTENVLMLPLMRWIGGLQPKPLSIFS